MRWTTGLECQVDRAPWPLGIRCRLSGPPLWERFPSTSAAALPLVMARLGVLKEVGVTVNSD